MHSPLDKTNNLSDQTDELEFFKKGFPDNQPITKVLNDDRIEKKEDSRTCVYNDGDVFQLDPKGAIICSFGRLDIL